MTVTEPLLPAHRPRWWEQPWDRVRDSPRRVRTLRWLVPTLIVALAAVLRLWGLDRPDDIGQFDESYYVKDAWSLWHLGYEGTWPSDGTERFMNGEVDAYSTQGSFVAHPPLGKWLIALGMVALGPESGWGWRLTTAIVGTLAVVVLMLVGRALTGSVAFGSLAGLFLAIDGLAIVMSRTALLDGILLLFVLLGVWFVLLDRARTQPRLLARWGPESGRTGRAWGPVVWNRPWVLAAGAAFGAASAVKWSGLYVLAGFGIYLVVTDALLRRRAGMPMWPADAVLRQGPVTFVLLVPVAFAVYLATWAGWLVTDGGYDRHSADDDPATGIAGLLPLAMQSLWRYHQAVYGFHIGVTSDHAYASPAWQWPLLLRPTAMYYRGTSAGVDGCTAASGCVEAVSSIPNPLLWWGGVLAVVYVAVRFVLVRDWRHGLVLTGIAVTYVPWLLYPERTTFQFYTVVLLPFVLLALVFALRDLPGTEDPTRRTAGQWVVTLIVLLAVAVSAWYYPVWTGMEVSYDFWRWHFSTISPSWV